MRSSHTIMTRTTTLMAKTTQSRVIGTQSIRTGCKLKYVLKKEIIFICYSLLTFRLAKLDTAATPKIFHISEPIIVPRPISDSAINVLITFVNISGVAVAVAINTAAPTSCNKRHEKLNWC